MMIQEVEKTNSYFKYLGFSLILNWVCSIPAYPSQWPLSHADMTEVKHGLFCLTFVDFNANNPAVRGIKRKKQNQIILFF